MVSAAFRRSSPHSCLCLQHEHTPWGWPEAGAGAETFPRWGGGGAGGLSQASSMRSVVLENPHFPDEETEARVGGGGVPVHS